ncbi:hypothetical protein DYP60_07455 [Sphaerochaeta halotolerans]|uniref:Transposase IS200-like domain-containing protein n=1 Tax=Sphaerochaeta halotolerans TaxID=2293840 RepID=A0A372MFX3_9SPIR|nr:hypothetical protein DYP60_07455 [Sphaerochaeta halotolerans]
MSWPDTESETLRDIGDRNRSSTFISIATIYYSFLFFKKTNTQVHLFVSSTSAYAPQFVVNQLKGSTSRTLRQRRRWLRSRRQHSGPVPITLAVWERSHLILLGILFPNGARGKESA